MDRSHEYPEGSIIVYHGDDQRVVVSYPVVPRYPPVLTESEREVALGVMCGESNAQIAEARGTSTHTIANQVAAIFAKLDVNSRAELAAKLHRACARCDPSEYFCEACPFR